MGGPLFVLRVLCQCVPVCLLLFIVISGDHFFSELKNMRGDADQVADGRNRGQAFPCPYTS